MPTIDLLARNCTLFTPTKALDEDAYREPLQRFIDFKIGPFPASGGSGEANSLSKEEVRRVYQIGVEVCRGKVPVYANMPEVRSAQGPACSAPPAWRRRSGVFLACILLIAGIESTHAQPAARSAGKTYPDRPVRTLVGLPAGGSVDIVVRSLSAKLTEAFGQAFVVDNRPGAGGLVAFDILSSAAADGHTLMAVGGTSIIYPLLYKSRYDILRDFAPVAQLTAQGYVLVIHPSLPANSVAEFVQYLKANPDKVNYASSGIGGALHMSAELFKLTTGTRMTHVPYKGTAPAYADLLGGQVHACFPTIITSLQHIKSGRLRALAVTTPKRVQAVPSVPTFDEAGVKGMVVVNWYGLVAPQKTPPPIIERLVTEINKAMRSPEMIKSMVADGGEAVTGSSAELAALIKSENERWSRVVQAVGMKVDLR